MTGTNVNQAADDDDDPNSEHDPNPPHDSNPEHDSGTNDSSSDHPSSDHSSSDEWFINGTGATTSHTLLANIRNGDRNAWVDLDHLYRPLLERWCLAEGVPTHDVAAVVNTIFTTVHRHIATYTHVSFRGWLRRITYTRAMDYFRQPRGEQAVGGSDYRDELEQFAEPDPRFETNADYTADEHTLLLRQAYQQVLASCHARTREIFTRVVEHQESPRVVAQAFGLEVGRIYSLRSQVLKRMNDTRETLESLLKNQAP